MTDPAPIGTWIPAHEAPLFGQQALAPAAERFREQAFIVQHPADGAIGVAFGGTMAPGTQPSGLPLLAILPPLYPEWLGDRGFCQAHGLRFPYVGGAMANGIASTEMVAALARAGCLGFFGAAGLPLAQVEAALAVLSRELEGVGPWGSNLIHNPHEPAMEDATVDLYLRHGVKRVSAAAYMQLTPALVRFACHGLRQDQNGQIQRANRVFAKISRPEVAKRFLEPAPADLLQALLDRGQLNRDEARLARLLPLAEDVTVEADSGGHTDNRPLQALFPVIAALRDELVVRHGYTRPVRLGAAGGLGTPAAVASAFGLGAAYVLTGSVNQACVESGLHERARQLLATAGLADVSMCPAADMFELGVQVQVLARGTLFAPRARKLYELYRAWPALDALPPESRTWLERDVLGCSIAEAEASTRVFWQQRDPRENERADADSHHLMALVFRSYLGQASRWAIEGRPERVMDYQIWCGPALGSFNAWTAGSFLGTQAQRSVVQVARNLLEGAAALTRAHQFRSYSVPIPPSAFDFRPRLLR